MRSLGDSMADMLGEACLRELHINPTDMTKFGVLLMVLCREGTFIFLSLELKHLKVLEEMFQQTFTIAEDRKIRQVPTNFETTALSDVCCRILADGVNRVPLAENR
jgi:hypothetical protein